MPVSTTSFESKISVIEAAGGQRREVAKAGDLRGLSWLPDSSGLVFSSSWGSTLPYPPIFNLRVISRDGSGERQLTFGDVSYEQPDVHSSGKLVTSRIRSQSDIWKFPVSGSPAENTRGGIRITRQTGQAQTPSVSPDDKEVVYLSDSGGHGNLWVARTDGSGVRQITFERDAAVIAGVPVWSAAGDWIVFILTRSGIAGQYLIHPDGSGVRPLIPDGVFTYWSADGRWIYYVVPRDKTSCIEKVGVEGGTPVGVRCDDAFSPAIAADGETLYYTTTLKRENGGLDLEVRKARPESALSQALARVASSRVPVDPAFFHPILSPDGKWLAVPLMDGATTNLWALPAEGGPMRPLTDFGQRPTLIVRRISWSPDGKYLYAAVAETDADIVLLDGLLP